MLEKILQSGKKLIIVAEGNGSYSCDIAAARDGMSDLFEFFHCCVDSFLDTLLDNHRICAGGNILHSLADECLCEKRCRSGAVTRDIVCFGCNFFDELCTHIFERIFKLDFF